MRSCKPPTRRSTPDGVKIATAARSWVGTPYQHQAQLRLVGVDCVGVILGTGKIAGFMDPATTDAAFKAFDGYSRVPNPRRMRQGMEIFLELADVAPDALEPPEGSIAWFQWRPELPMHLAVIGRFQGRVTMIHAYALSDKCVEHGFDSTWRGRVNSFWKFKGSSL